MFSAFLTIHRSDWTRCFYRNVFGALISYSALIDEVPVYGSFGLIGLFMFWFGLEMVDIGCMMSERVVSCWLVGGCWVLLLARLGVGLKPQLGR
jgi:hypothetical protein